MEETNNYKAHIVVLPYHGQGHLNPMLQFSKRLSSKGIKITLATTLSNTKSIQEEASLSASIEFESIYDDLTHGGVAAPGGFKGFLDRFEAVGSRNLIDLIKRIQDSSDGNNCVKCLIYDANISWASNVADEVGNIAMGAFFTQSCAFVAQCYPMHCDLLGVSPYAGLLASMLDLPELRIPNLPSLGAETGCYPPIIRYILRQFDNCEKADWILFNSFHHLEEEVINWMSKIWPVRPIGPTLPSIYLDNRVKDDDNYGFNIHKPNTETCMKWLDSKKTRSVIYISFGSAASLNAEQISELANALLQSENSFLWVVKPSEEDKLPAHFKDRIKNCFYSDKGLVVKWAPQLAVLQHDSIGCFVSHCGWNSTMEAISLGVGVVAMPQFLDQMTNAYFVEHVWHVGIKPKTDENGCCARDEIDRCIEEIMHGERGEVIKKNVARWKALAKEAIDEGGSSDKCIDEIIARLCS
ncbi:hypothetical protein ABFS83_03G003200 [Erythranthe nasuta]